MQPGQIWDYFMRRKILFFVALMFIVVLGRFCGSFGQEKLDNPIPEVPRTGEIIDASSQEDGCDIDIIEFNYVTLGGGESDLEEKTWSEGEMTFWNEEMPDPSIFEQVNNDSTKTESLIVSLGFVAAAVVILAAKFIFDRYVR